MNKNKTKNKKALVAIISYDHVLVDRNHIYIITKPVSRQFRVHWRDDVSSVFIERLDLMSSCQVHPYPQSKLRQTRSSLYTDTCTLIKSKFNSHTYLKTVGSGIPGSAPRLNPEKQIHTF